MTSTDAFLRRARLPALLALVLALSGCQPSSGGAPGGGGFPPPEVTAITVAPRDVAVTYEYVAQAAGSREVEVRARVSGILLKRNYVEGAPVKRGQSLFTVDPAPYQAALARAEADVAMAQARLAQAEREVARLKPVLAAKAVSRKELDDATSAAQIAAAELQGARARLNEAKLNLEYTRVEAPISGTSSRALVSEGTLVSGPGVLLTTITQSDPMYVLFGIPDREYLALRRDVDAGRLKLPGNGGFRATVKLADGSVYPREGTVNFRDVRVNAQTGTSEARAVFPNPDGRLRAGEFARIVLHGATRPAAIVVPQRAVLESPKGKYVYLVGPENKAVIRPVEAGEWAGDGWIINSGLAPGDRVIVDGVAKLQIMPPGVPVKVVEASAAKPAAGQPGSGGQPQAKPAAKAEKKAAR